MSEVDVTQLLLETLQLWEKKEKAKNISLEGLNLLQEDVDIVFKYLNKSMNQKSHFENCDAANMVSSYFKYNKRSCECLRYKFALHRMKQPELYYK